MDDVAFPLTHNLGLLVLVDEEIRQWHIQHGGDPLERLQGRHGSAVLELTDKASGDPRTLGKLNGCQATRLSHTLKLFPQIHWRSLPLVSAYLLLAFAFPTHGEVVMQSVHLLSSSPKES